MRSRMIEKIMHTLCLAPMLDWTDTHFRYFIRLLAPHCFLYTEMVTTGALLRGDPHRFLSYHPQEHPIALQLGGCDPKALSYCASMARRYGYDEVNLNVGCPSDRVQRGRFGACLMKEPNLVAECVTAMKEQAGSAMLVSVKCRLGVDNQQDFSFLERFVEAIQRAGCDHVIIHAREAWLKGLNPKENRDIPPLNYPWVYQLKAHFPALKIIINGGIKTIADAVDHLVHVDGVMIGRPAYENAFFFRECERAFFSTSAFCDEDSIKERLAIIRAYLPYVDAQLLEGVRLSRLLRPLLSLFNGIPGSKQWRRMLTEAIQQGHGNACFSIIEQYIKKISISGEFL